MGQVLSSLVLEAHPSSLEQGRVFFFIFFGRLPLFLPPFPHIHILFIFKRGRARFATRRGFERGKVSNIPTLYGLELAAFPRSVFWINRRSTLGLLLNGEHKACSRAENYARVTRFVLENPLSTSREISFGAG